MTVVTTEGHAETHLASERCTLTIRVHQRAGTAELATTYASHIVADLARRAQGLRERGDATWHHVSAVSTSLYSVADDERPAEYRAHAEVQIKLRNLSLVGRLTVELAAEGLSTYPRWSLTEATQKAATRQVRIEAVHAARERADDYAAALDGKVIDVLEVSDGADHYVGSPLRSAGAAGSPNADAAAALTIPEQTVSARITARFDVR